MIYAGIVEHALGIVRDKPMRLLTDNLGNMNVAGKLNTSSRSRYFKIRAACLDQRVRDGQIEVIHVGDPSMVADYLTKPTSEAKLDASVDYLSGTSRSRKKAHSHT